MCDSETREKQKFNIPSLETNMHIKRQTVQRLFAILFGAVSIGAMPSTALAKAYPSKPINPC
jgi:hypothetical protein